MKIKRLSGTRVELEDWEAEQLIKEIRTVVRNYDRNGSTVFPLALHGFAEKLKESQR